jgi:hypothetical protein
MRIKNQYKLTYLLVHIDLILHYLFNKLYKIQVIQNTGYTKYMVFIFTYHNCPLQVPLRRHLATA